MKKLKLFGFLLLAVLSTIYSYKQPAKLKEKQDPTLYVTLEGAFKKNGEVKIKEGTRMRELVEQVGVKENANLAALNLDQTLHSEKRYYLPLNRSDAISLNHASKEELMALRGVGEKTADRIIAYREKNVFNSLEDIMNVEGIGEKRYLAYRDCLCL